MMMMFIYGGTVPFCSGEPSSDLLHDWPSISYLPIDCGEHYAASSCRRQIKVAVLLSSDSVSQLTHSTFTQHQEHFTLPTRVPGQIQGLLFTFKSRAKAIYKAIYLDKNLQQKFQVCFKWALHYGNGGLTRRDYLLHHETGICQPHLTIP